MKWMIISKETTYNEETFREACEITFKLRKSLLIYVIYSFFLEKVTKKLNLL